MNLSAKNIAAVALVAVVAAAGLVWIIDDSDNDAGESQSHPSVAESSLSAAEKDRLEKTALTDPLVQELTRGVKTDVDRSLEWTSEDGSRLLGAGVYITLDPPIDLDSKKLPVFYSPNPEAPPGTPTVRRSIIYSAKDVSVLKVRALLSPEEVVQVEPMGNHLDITKVHLVGTYPGKDYRPIGD
jgi:hypothetical protein